METPAAATAPCGRCGTPLAAEALVCPQCRSLVHSARLEELSARARQHEASGDATAAASTWREALPLMPPDSAQGRWVSDKLQTLDGATAATQPAATATQSPWRRRLRPLLMLAPLLAKGKALLALLKFKFLLSFVGFAGIYWALYGIRFGVGLAVLVLLHELGHLIEARRRGLSTELPMFIPGFGAYVRYNAAGADVHARALIALAGPCAGTLAALACAVVWLQTQYKLWLALAAFSAFVNLLNLIPVWTLDGGQALGAVNRAGRIGLAIAALLFAAFFQQPMLLFVAAAAGFHAVRNDPANELAPDYVVTAYFIVLLVVLGYVSSLAALATRIAGH